MYIFKVYINIRFKCLMLIKNTTAYYCIICLGTRASLLTRCQSSPNLGTQVTEKEETT